MTATNKLNRRSSSNFPKCHALGKRTNVYETLTLLNFPATIEEDSVSAVVDEVWSLQYRAAGPICGSAGPFTPLATAPTSIAPAFTHAVLFRYGEQRLLESFMSNPRIKDMLDTSAPKTARTVVTLSFSSIIPNELEAIFRRGSEWDEGYEMVVALKLHPGSSEEDAMEFLNLTQQLATSSAYGAVQAGAGKCASLVTHGSADSSSSTDPSTEIAPDYMLLVRFQTKEQLLAFVQCPAVGAALEGDERSPIKALWAGSLVITPSDNSTTKPHYAKPL
ncbi:hypothetical protein Ndes2526B_g03625 [Nannochloris sp. 'desiccata']